MLGGLLSGIGSAVGGALGFIGQNKTNETNALLAKEANEFSSEQAQRQMDFQERMSNSAYQRAVADLKKAGLNPALAWMQGGASSPAGQAGAATSAKSKNALSHLGDGVSRAGSSAMETMRGVQALEVGQKSLGVMDSQKNLADAQGLQAIAAASKDRAQAEATQLGLSALDREGKLRAKRAEYDLKALEFDSVMSRILQTLGGVSSAASIGSTVKKMFENKPVTTSIVKKVLK